MSQHTDEPHMDMPAHAANDAAAADYAHAAAAPATSAATVAVPAPVPAPAAAAAAAAAHPPADAMLPAVSSAPTPSSSPPPTPLTKGQKKRAEKERLAAAAAALAAAGGDSAAAAAAVASANSNSALINLPNPPRKATAAASASAADRPPRADRDPKPAKHTQPQQPTAAQPADADQPAPRPRVVKAPRGAKHERHPSTGSNSSNASSNAAGPSSTASAAAAGRGGGYARGMPSQYAAVTAQSNGSEKPASAHASSFPAVGSSASAASSAAAVVAAAPAAAASASKLPFHDPPSLFRFHSQRAPALTVSPAGLVPLEGAGSPVPPFYAPVNLLRLIRALTPKLSASGSGFTLGQLWSFYDNPYGHEIDVLLDSNLLLHPHAPPAAQSGYTLEGTEVYYVSHLSALVLYEHPSADSAANAPPLLSWFERVSPHQRMPLLDSIAAIASCFSPPPSSPLYDLFKPYPSTRILHALHSSQLDLTRSWMAITWYPILHDPLSSPFLTGSFLLYHALQYDAGSSSKSKSKHRGDTHVQPRSCPMQEARGWGPPQPSPSAAAAAVPASTASAAAVPAPSPSRIRSRALLSSLSANSDVDGGTTAGSDAEVSEAGDDADGESDDDDRPAASSSAAAAAASCAVESKSPEVSGVSTTPMRRHRSHGHGKLLPSSFPAHLCPHCGDRHGPPQPTAEDAAAAAVGSPPLSYLPVLGYLCHRVLPSTWFVQACQPAPHNMHTHAASAANAAAAASSASAVPAALLSLSSLPPPPAVAAAAAASCVPPFCFPSLSLPAVGPPLLPPASAFACVSPCVDVVAAFNAQLHTPAAFAHLTLAQPARLTHVDLSRAMMSVLQSQAAQHPDLMHMTGTTAMPGSSSSSSSSSAQHDQRGQA